MNLDKNSPNFKKQWVMYAGFGSLLLLLVGLGAAKLLTSKQQDVRNQASTGTGTAEVKLSPTNITINQGETKPVTVSFNPQGQSISGVSVRIQYAFTGTTPQLKAENIVPVITNSNSNWSCPVTQVNTLSNVVNVDIGCIYNSTEGFVRSTDTTLATFQLKASNDAQTNVYTLTFDPQSTIITLKTTGEDVAAIPQSVATVNISSNNQTPTNTPTPTSQAPTATPTPTLTQSNVTTTTTTDGLACNQSCTANRDCASDLACLSGYCRSPRCPDDASCECNDKDVAKETGTTDLPNTGGIDYTLISLIIGFFFLVGGSSLLVYNLKRD